MEKHRYRFIWRIVVLGIISVLAVIYRHSFIGNAFNNKTESGEKMDIYLSDLLKEQPHRLKAFTGLAVEGGAGMGYDRTYDNQAININGTRYKKGIGMHSNDTNTTYLEVDIEGLGYASFSAEVGMQNQKWPQEIERNSAIFYITVDGNTAYESNYMTHDTPAERVSVNIQDAKVLRLCLDYGMTPYSDSAVWADARLSCKTHEQNQEAQDKIQLSKNAVYKKLANDTISLTIAIDNNRQYITSIVNPKNKHEWMDTIKAVPQIETVSGETVTWHFTGAEEDTTKISGINTYTVTAHFSCNEKNLLMHTYWMIRSGAGPVEYRTEIVNNSGEHITVREQDLNSCDLILNAGGKAGLMQFSKIKMVNAQDINHKKGVLIQDISAGRISVNTPGMYDNSGALPFTILQTENNHGAYFGFEWISGIMSFTGFNTDIGRFRIKAFLSYRNTEISRNPGVVLTIPAMYIGTYEGDADDGSNEMKDWFWRNKMTASLRENEQEPPVELHIPAYSEQEWKDYLTRNPDIKSWGVQLLKMDYDWTDHSVAFGNNTQMTWLPKADKWPNGMTWRSLIDPYFSKAGLSLYMPDTYQWVDIGTEEGRQRQIDAIRERILNWGIDYWRSDFQVEGNATYAEHEGLLYILDTLIADPEIPDFRYEHCSGGGGAKDFSTLQRMTFMTTEDWARALQHRMAFYTNSYMINPLQLKADISIDWAPFEDEQTDLEGEEWTLYNFRTGLLGAMMVSKHADLTDRQKEIAKDTWHLYHTKQREILRNCNVYHILPMPDGINWDGIQFFNPNIKKGSVILFKPDKNAEESKTIYLDGLDPKATYVLEFEDRKQLNCKKTGAELMASGITVTGMTQQYDSEIIWITASPSDKSSKLLTVFAITGALALCGGIGFLVYKRKIKKLVNK